MQTRMTSYKMIVFDAGGTLIGADWSRVTEDLAAVARNRGLVVEPAAVMAGMRSVWDDVLSGKIPDSADSREAVTAFWHQMLARSLTLAAGVAHPAGDGPVDSRAWKAARTFYPTFDGGDYHRLIDGAETTLQALRAAGFRLALLSNWSPLLPQVLTRLDIHHYFEFVIVSALEGVAKPDRAIFDLAVERSGCRPDELLYVGDSPAADIAGSRAAGWDAVLIANRRTEAEAPLKVDRLVNLPELLGIA